MMHTLYDVTLEDVFEVYDVTYDAYSNEVDGQDVVEIELRTVTTAQGEDVLNDITFEQCQALEIQCLEHLNSEREEDRSESAYAVWLSGQELDY
jgi:hypothetical protein